MNQPVLEHHSVSRLIAWGLLSAGIYGAISWLSGEFTEQTPAVQRPILQTLGLFGAAFAFYLAALREAVRTPDKKVLGALFGFAVTFRGVLLPSEPIQEVDIYRYIWDGHATEAGVNPYRYSPEQVWEARNEEASGELGTLADLLRNSDGLKDILRRVHFAELRSPYPAASQAVFAIVAWASPNSASARTHVRLMKLALTLFDLAAMWVLILLLRILEKPAGWALAYGWCPLVLKEFANSGHLDSIAVFLTVSAVFLLTKHAYQSDKKDTIRNLPALLFSAVLLGLATGAKYYPLVLTPLFAAVGLRRCGWRKTVVAALMFLVTTGMCLAPAINAALQGRSECESGETNKDGLTAFLRTWEINDFLFMVVVENLKTPDQLGSQPEAWFSVVPDGVRQALHSSSVAVFGDQGRTQAFLVTRILTAFAFCLVLAWLLVRVWREPNDSALWLESVFLTLAWFWFLAPTQNPWYWTWALPFVCFAQSRVWLAVGGVSLLYYLRFWFEGRFSGQFVWGTPYQGVTGFDLIVPWLEFAPLLAWLSWNAARRRRGAIRKR